MIVKKLIFIAIVFVIGIIILCIWRDDEVLKDYKINYLNKKLNANNIKTWAKQYKKFNDYNINLNLLDWASRISLDYNEFIKYANLSDTDIFSNISYNNMKQFFDNHRITIFSSCCDLIIPSENKFDNISTNDNFNFIINKDSNAEIKIFKGEDEKGLCLSFKFVYIRSTRIYFNSIEDYKHDCIWLEELIYCYTKYNKHKNFCNISNIVNDKSKINLTKERQ